MSTHPALSPRLGRSQVTSILHTLDQEINTTLARRADTPFGPVKLELDGRAAGLGRARQILADAWEAEVVLTSAVSQWIAPLVQEEDQRS